MMFRFGKKSQADDPADVEVAAIDGPGQPLEIHTPPPGTKRLSKKASFYSWAARQRWHRQF